MLEELADQILRTAARKSHKSFRQLGIIDDRRLRTIRSREITMSYIESRRNRNE